MMLSGPCRSCWLLHLPDDVFIIISRSLDPRDICNLSLCCRSLRDVMASEKVWLAQCDMMGIVPLSELVEWRRGVSSYQALCQFLVSVQPLIGIWVHQNPELGNVVYVMPGFVSVVGCRIIPQELGPLGIQDGPILWAPVFEIVGDFDGSSVFFLHGREGRNDYLYPGSLKPVERKCNVLMLEVEPVQWRQGTKLLHSKSLVYNSDKELSRKVSRSKSALLRSQKVVEQHNEVKVPFSLLGFGDRRKLLEIVTRGVRLKVPGEAIGPLFPSLRDNEDNFQESLALLLERRPILLQMFKLGNNQIDWNTASQLTSDPTLLESSDIKKSFDCSPGSCTSLCEDNSDTKNIKKKDLRVAFRNCVKQILGKSISSNRSNAISKNTSNSENKHVQLYDFLRSADTIRLTLHASTMKLSSYRAWPNMHNNRFALYKLPMRAPSADQEYAGLWGGTFGWPPGKPTEDKPGKALFFLLLSYEETQLQRLLIATKILEGTHYVLHPNGSAMFIANIHEPSFEAFPWDTDEDALAVNIKHAFTGEGIANGYGFRYPGAKPGSLFVFENGLLAFIWKESKAVLTLQRLNLQYLLKKGERVPALIPIANFSYLTKSYSNVFADFPNASSCLSSPRQKQ